MVSAPSRPEDIITGILDLVAIMARLRTPGTGCAWDLEQNFETIAPYTIEEAYEVADAINRGDMNDLREELGDLILQVVFHSRMAEEAGSFSLSDVLHTINAKMIRRHPHVFADEASRTGAEQASAWEEMKAAERAARNDTEKQAHSALDGVALALPALLRAEKLQKRAARTGFDWTDPVEIFDKVAEETEEVREAVATADRQAIEEELGDLLFVTANLARRFDIDPEQALRRANAKFERRFRAMEEAAIRTGRLFADLTLQQQEGLWSAVKQAEKG